MDNRKEPPPSHRWGLIRKERDMTNFHNPLARDKYAFRRAEYYIKQTLKKGDPLTPSQIMTRRAIDTGIWADVTCKPMTARTFRRYTNVILPS